MALRDSSFKFMQFVQSIMSLGGVNCKQQESLDLPLTPGTVVFRGVRKLMYKNHRFHLKPGLGFRAKPLLGLGPIFSTFDPHLIP